MTFEVSSNEKCRFNCSSFFVNYMSPVNSCKIRAILTLTYSNMENLKDVIMQCNVKFLNSFNNGDAKGVASNYIEKAQLLPPNSDIIQGLDGIEAFWQGAMDMGLKKAELETLSAEGHGDTAIEMGKYKLYLENGQVADIGKYMVIWRKVNGTWKFDLDIWNSSNPPA